MYESSLDFVVIEEDSFGQMMELLDINCGGLSYFSLVGFFLGSLYC